MDLPSDAEKLCQDMSLPGVEPELVEIARKDLAAHCRIPESWMHLASTLRRNRHYHACLAAYEAAIARFSDSHAESYRLWGNLGVLFREWERYQEALELEPGYVHAQESMAMTLERMHRFREAAENYVAV